METLRVSFLSGSVLELAATLGVALVAVTAGVRLVGGSLGLQTGLTVIVLAPEVYLPFRRLGAEYHASADGLAVAERLLALLDAPDGAAAGGPRAVPDPRDGSRPVRAGVVHLPDPSRTRPQTGWTWSSRRVRRWRWSARAAPARARSRPCCSGCSSRRGGRISVGGVDLAGCDIESWRRQVAWVPQHPTLLRGSVADNIRLGDPAASERRVREAASPGRRTCVHRAAAGRLRHARRGRATLIVARRAPADRPRPRVSSRRAARHPRRADRRSRRPQRVGGVGRRRAPASRTDRAADRAPSRIGLSRRPGGHHGGRRGHARSDDRRAA